MPTGIYLRTKKHNLAISKGLKKIKHRPPKLKGKDASNWQGGKIKRAGYIYIHKPEHPFSQKQGYVAEHRLVMEKFLGRYLKPQETIHHINHNITDNRIQNLELYATHGQHTKFCHPEVFEKARLANLGRKPTNHNRGFKICPICQTSFETTFGTSGKIFCSKLCFDKSLKGKRNSIKTEFKKGQPSWNKGLRRIGIGVWVKSELI